MRPLRPSRTDTSLACLSASSRARKPASAPAELADSACSKSKFFFNSYITVKTVDFFFRFG